MTSEPIDPLKGGAHPPEETSPTSAGAIFKEALLVYFIALVAIIVLALLAPLQGFLQTNLYLFVALLFFGIPALWMKRKMLDGQAFGLMMGPKFARNVAVGLVASLLTFIPFIAGQYLWETGVRGQTFAFDPAHIGRWDVATQGAPRLPGNQQKVPGAWVWSEERVLHFALQTEERFRAGLVLESATPFVPDIEGSALVVRALEEDGTRRTSREPARRWVLSPVVHGRVVRGVWHERPGALVPNSLTVRTTRLDGYQEDPLALHIGGEEAFVSEPGSTGFELTKSLEWLFLWLLTQLFFIALPEEYFYRGYLQTRLSQAFEARAKGRGDRWLGSLVTRSNLSTSILFGLGHLLVPVGGVLLAGRLAVFFPSLLFGLLRERTGTITAPVVYHACCNMMVLFMSVHYW